MRPRDGGIVFPEGKTLPNCPVKDEMLRCTVHPPISVTLMDGEVVSWPESHKTELKHGDVYYTVPASCDALQMQWGTVENDNGRLKMGSVHLTKEAAEQHSYALFKINNQVAK